MRMGPAGFRRINRDLISLSFDQLAVSKFLKAHIESCLVIQITELIP
jgi:hypothetical protein